MIVANRTGKLLALFLAVMCCATMSAVGVCHGDVPFAAGFVVMLMCFAYMLSIEYSGES